MCRMNTGIPPESTHVSGADPVIIEGRGGGVGRQVVVSRGTADRPTGRRTIVLCYLSIAEWTDPGQTVRCAY